MEKWIDFHGPDCNTIMSRFPLQSSAIDKTFVAADRSLKHEIVEMSNAIKGRCSSCARPPERFFSRWADWLDIEVAETFF